MLYVFQVDTGQMLCFEMDVAVSTVTALKTHIQQLHGIPTEKQVLVVSGGEILEPNSRVCNYAAGTDTNPIFLFNKLNIEGGGSLQGGNNPHQHHQNQQQQNINNNQFDNNSSTVVGTGVESLSSGGGGSSGTNNVQITDLETIHRQIESSNTLPPTYMSVVTRTQLAQHVFDMGREIIRKCEILIHHQHLQHQGWAAVMSHNDDIVSLVKSKLQNFVGAYGGFCGEFSREHIHGFVNGLDVTLKTLDTIKLPEYYVSSAAKTTENAGGTTRTQTQTTTTSSSPPCNSSSSSSPTTTSSSPPPNRSIVQWLSEHYSTSSSLPASSPITSSSPSSPVTATPLHAHLQSLATSSRKTYDHLTSENFLQTLQQEAASVIDKASSLNMKEIKGLEERLYGLDQLLQEAKHLVDDQSELTQAFHQNVSRASDLRDSSIFPDLCASHQQQLIVMYKNHSQLEDIRRRCARAKEELTYNLNTRLKWIVHVQKSLSDISGKIGLFHESLRRLRVNVNVLQQISECESEFNQFQAEVVRRSHVFSKLHTGRQRILQFNSIALTENSRRADFRAKHAGHFLSQAFHVLVEDREVAGVPVPQLVEYLRIGDVSMMEEGAEGEAEEEEDDGGSRAERRALTQRVKELEATVTNLQIRNEQIGNLLIDKGKAVEVERDRVKRMTSELENVRGSACDERMKVAKLSNTVDDLKRLLDEFRVKEEENIKLHAQEVSEYATRMRNLEETCDKRVVELTRMMEFECQQKIKGVEEMHRLEFEAFKSRFKLVNKTNVFGGSCEKIASAAGIGGTNSIPPLSPVALNNTTTTITSTAAKRPSIVAANEDLHHHHGHLSRTYHNHPMTTTATAHRGVHGEIVFSSDDDSGDHSRMVNLNVVKMEEGDEDEEEDQEEESRRRRRGWRRGGGGGAEEDYNSGDDAGGVGGGGSLERAVDAAAYLDDDMGGGDGAGNSTAGTERGGGGGGGSGVNSSEVFVSDRVVTIATRLHKLGRVSVSTCRVGGEANLFYWNDKFNAFTVYLNNRNVHFLNTSERNSSSTSGGVGGSHGDGVPKSLSTSKLFIAHITDKEFCVARRSGNRYNVPQGFHFYRVKCRVIEMIDE